MVQGGVAIVIQMIPFNLLIRLSPRVATNNHLSSVHPSDEMGSDVILQIFNPRKHLRFEYHLQR